MYISYLGHSPAKVSKEISIPFPFYDNHFRLTFFLPSFGRRPDVESKRAAESRKVRERKACNARSFIQRHTWHIYNERREKVPFPCSTYRRWWRFTAFAALSLKGTRQPNREKNFRFFSFLTHICIMCVYNVEENRETERECRLVFLASFFPL